MDNSSPLSILPVTTPAQLETFCTLAPTYPLAPTTPAMQEADAHWLAYTPGGEPVARCSLWWRQTAAHPTHRLGYIGHYATRTAGPEATAGAQLLAHAASQLATQGATLAVGPIDGNTFRRYRLVTEQSLNGIERPPFLLEPENPASWPQHFAAAAFDPLLHYFSAWGLLPEQDPIHDALAQRAGRHGVQLRPANLDDLEAELSRIYSLVIHSFAGNYLYSPITEAEFIQQNKAARPFLHPELVWVAERAGTLLGFIFALPDMTQAQRGEPVDTVIIKTVAVLPEVVGAGLGALLVARCQLAARRLGYRQVIHALMHEGNLSRRISDRYAIPMRRYTLFAKPL
jgi:GNAT superfamily N-acetyltransferase